MCGIVGVVGTSAVNQRLYDGLTVLQHRGQDAAGIATYGDGELCVRKGSGLVRDVFQQHHMLELKAMLASATCVIRQRGVMAPRKRNRSTSTRHTASAWRTTET